MKIYKNIKIPSGIGWNGAAYKEGYEKGKEDQKEKLISTSVTENGTYTAEDGFSAVTVDVEQTPCHTQERWVNITMDRLELDGDYLRGYETLTPEDGYAGMSQVNLSAAINISGLTADSYGSGYTSGLTDGYDSGVTHQRSLLSSTSITENGTYTSEDGFSEVVVDVPEKEVHLEPLGAVFSANGNYDIRVHSGYDGFRSPASFFVDVPQTGYTQQDLDNAYASGMTAGYQSGWTEAMEECQRDWSKEYLTVEALENGNFYVRNENFEFSKNDGAWTSGVGNQTIPLVTGDKVRFRYNANSSIQGRFSGNTMSFKVYGNIESMEYGDNFSGQTTVKLQNAFNNCFFNSSGLTDASNLILPATALTESCYSGLFCGTSITVAPALPATQLARECYSAMFSGCTALTTAPELPATQLTRECYYRMFKDCTGLRTAPELPTTTLADYCYTSMFDGCINLTTAPDLPAPVLVRSCYYHMFDGCVRLAHIKCLATDISAIGCTEGWFNGHRPNGTFTKAAGMEDWTRGVDGIPEAWTVVDAS